LADALLFTGKNRGLTHWAVVLAEGQGAGVGKRRPYISAPMRGGAVGREGPTDGRETGRRWWVGADGGEAGAGVGKRRPYVSAPMRGGEVGLELRPTGGKQDGGGGLALMAERQGRASASDAPTFRHR